MDLYGINHFKFFLKFVTFYCHDIHVQMLHHKVESLKSIDLKLLHNNHCSFVILPVLLNCTFFKVP